MSLTSYSGSTGGAKYSAIAADLVSQFNGRLTEELIRSGIPSQARLRFLSRACGRAPQTVHRWIDSEQPGMPDLRSFGVLCLLFQVDANWLLGLTQYRAPLPNELLPLSASRQLNIDQPGVTDWVSHIVAKVRARPESPRIEVMHGHDMEPLIHDGGIIFIDDSVSTVTVNGTYLLEYRDRYLVRHVEHRIDEGLILRCENRKYHPMRIANGDAKMSSALNVIGQVTMAVNVVSLM